MMTFDVPGQKSYSISDVEQIRTPRLLVFRDRVERNLARMKAYLEEVVPGSAYGHLCTHVKTHKSSHIVRMMMEAGVTSFKATLNEVDLLARCDVNEIFVAYPLLFKDAVKLSQSIVRYPEIRFFVQIGSPAHADILREVASREGVHFSYFIDLDVGMHRTGISPDKAFQLFSYVSGWSEFEFVGLHGYDGHIHHADAEEREQEAQKAMGSLLGVYETFRKNGVSVERVVVSGSISFRLDLDILLNRVGSKTAIQVSPGNWIYWDSNNDAILPGAFEIAAVVLAQVIEIGEDAITLNLGHKRWGADRGPVELFSRPDLRVRSFNEEHTVLEFTGGASFSVGDYVLIAPKHACSTVNLYEHFTLIGEDGGIEVMASPVDGRNQ